MRYVENAIKIDKNFFIKLELLENITIYHYSFLNIIEKSSALKYIWHRRNIWLEFDMR